MDLGHATWRKSTRSSHEDCVEVAHLADYIAFRDSKSPESGALVIPNTHWHPALTTHLHP